MLLLRLQYTSGFKNMIPVNNVYPNSNEVFTELNSVIEPCQVVFISLYASHYDAFLFLEELQHI